MYPHVKKSVRPKRKQDYSFPDGTKPTRTQWISGGRVNPDRRWILDWWGRWDRARLGEEIASWERDGKLIYTPRIHYTIELRKSVRIDGKPTPKTIKTWFLTSKVSDRREFYRRVMSDLAELGATPSEADRLRVEIETRLA